MPARRVALTGGTPAPLVDGLAAIRERLQVPADFPPDVPAEAERGTASPVLPDLDRTGLELVTLDPPGARDLDQALHIARDGRGYVVSYAIADVAAFVAPGDAVDREAHRRGCTLYAPDHRTPLHPPAISEAAASLLAGEVRPALLWTIRLGEDGKMTDVDVARALVRSREQLDYEQAQAEIDSGRARQTLALLAVVGDLRLGQERDRGGVSLPLPDQEVHVDGEHWSLEFRSPLPVEGWNAQISLLTGMAAAHIMLYGEVGILRTLPPADNAALRRLRQTARALRIAWPPEVGYPAFVRSLDPDRADHAAMLTACTELFRGAGNIAFSGSIRRRGARGAGHRVRPHHCSAAPAGGPLCRRDPRGPVCRSTGARLVLQALDRLPGEMKAAEHAAHAYERAVVDLVEVFLLADRVGDTFPGTVVEVDESRRRGVALVKDPAVEARVSGEQLPLGHEVSLRLTSADYDRGAVQFELV